jgi:acyl dehydratase
MAKSEQDKLIDAWVDKQNQRRGEIVIPRVGEYPPQPECWYGTMLNEWVTTDTIRHFADAMGDKNLLWRSHDYARGTRWGGIIAPPTITDTIVQPYAGRMAEDPDILNFDSWFLVPNGSVREMHQVVRPGDRFRVIQTYLGMTELEEPIRENCREFDDAARRTIINQREEIVAIHDRHMSVVINYALDDDHPYWPKRQRRRLTDEERDSIQRGYEENSIRGNKTLYWEDVVVGEELKPLIVGPLSVYDIAACYTAVSGHAVAFDLEWERIKVNFDFHWLDPEVNAWTCSGICHFIDNKGHAMVWDGGPAVSFYFQIEWLLGRLITDWMGDDGFLKRLDDRFPILPMLGEVLCQKGRVTNKYVDNGEHLVDLEVHCENLDGLLMVPGSATVRLPSYTDLTAY